MLGAGLCLLASGAWVWAGEPVAPEALVAEAIEACRAHSMRSGELDWSEIESGAQDRLAGGAESHEVIAWIVGSLQDGHSSMLTPEEAARVNGEADSAEPGRGARGGMPPPIEPSGRVIDVDGARVGYIRVPYLIAMGGPAMKSYGETLGTLQRELAEHGARAWVIDLRRNVGGNQWPMLAGLSGILGDGAHGSVQPPGGRRMAWGTARGVSWAGSGNEKTTVVSIEGYEAPDTSAWPVAVLTDQRTASSGETIVVSFKGRARTRSFGDPTRGASSANATVELADGTLLNITTSALFDAAGHAYGGPIRPDEAFGLVPPTREDAFPGEGGADDPVLERALEWARAQIEE